MKPASFLVALILYASVALSATVTLYCAAPATEPQLSKSFVGVYQTPFWFKKRPPGGLDANRMLALLREAGVRDLRYELAWGKPDVFAADQVGVNAAGRPTLDPLPLNPFLRGLADAGISPLLVLSYCPTPLQRGTPGWQRWKDVPDPLAWAAVCRQASIDWKFCRPTFEIWNEPDLPGDGRKMFFAGNPHDYGKVYNAAATSLAPAPVGGPAVAYSISASTSSPSTPIQMRRLSSPQSAKPWAFELARFV
jgi:hypothetical protein